MSKTVALRLPDETYRQLRILAERENRPLSNFIKTVALRYLEAEQFVDEFEMKEIQDNAEPNRNLSRGMKDAKAGCGRLDKIAVYL